MVWQDYKIDGDKITITKQEIKESYEHFCKVADKFKPKKNKDMDMRWWLYIGKADALLDLLKMFEQLKGE